MTTPDCTSIDTNIPDDELLENRVRQKAIDYDLGSIDLTLREEDEDEEKEREEGGKAKKDESEINIGAVKSDAVSTEEPPAAGASKPSTVTLAPPAAATPTPSSPRCAEAYSDYVDAVFEPVFQDAAS